MQQTVVRLPQIDGHTRCVEFLADARADVFNVEIGVGELRWLSHRSRSGVAAPQRAFDDLDDGFRRGGRPQDLELQSGRAHERVFPKIARRLERHRDRRPAAMNRFDQRDAPHLFGAHVDAQHRRRAELLDELDRVVTVTRDQQAESMAIGERPVGVRAR